MSYVDYPTTASNATVENQLAEINRYLYRLADTLNHNIDTEGADNLLEKALKYIETENDSSSDPTASALTAASISSYDKAVSMYKSLKSMIISTATNVYSSETEPIINVFTSEYKAVSDKYGTLDDRITTSIEQSSAGIGVVSSRVETINSDLVSKIKTTQSNIEDVSADVSSVSSKLDTTKYTLQGNIDDLGNTVNSNNKTLTEAIEGLGSDVADIEKQYDGYINVGWLDKDDDIFGIDIGCLKDTIRVGDDEYKGVDNKRFIRITPSEMQFNFINSNGDTLTLASINETKLWFPNADIEGGTIKIGPYTSNGTTDYYFKVDEDGALTATKANITGAITATSLELGSGVKLDYNTDIKNLPDIPEGADLTYYIKAEDGKVYDGEDDDGNYSKISVSSKGLLTAENAVISGKIVASSGNIGGFQILSSKNVTGTFLRYRYAEASVLGDDLTFYLMPGGYKGSVSLAGSTEKTGWVMAIGSYFAVDGSGNLYAQNAVVSGSITATSGRIGEFSIGLSSDNTTYYLKYGTVGTGKDNTFSLSPAGKATALDYGDFKGVEHSAMTVGSHFAITTDGTLYAKNVKITGEITATSLTLDGTSLSYNDLTDIPTMPSLTGYIHTTSKDNDGTIGTTPASGTTGFTVSTAGLLQASNAVIWGNIYASGGNIGGFEVLTATNVKGTFMRYKPDDDSSCGKDDTFYIMPQGYYKQATYNEDGSEKTAAGISIAGSDKMNYWVMTIGSNFGVNRKGGLYCSAVHITGGDLSIGGNFGITKEGAVTASNITVTGGSLNINSKFIVTAAGACTAKSLSAYNMYSYTAMYIHDDLKVYCADPDTDTASNYKIALQWYNDDNSVCVGVMSEKMTVRGQDIVLKAGSVTTSSGTDYNDDIYLQCSKVYVHNDLYVKGTVYLASGGYHQVMDYSNSTIHVGYSDITLALLGSGIKFQVKKDSDGTIYYKSLIDLYNKVYGTSY